MNQTTSDLGNRTHVVRMTYGWRIATLIFFGGIGAVIVGSMIATKEVNVLNILGAGTFLFVLSLPVVFVWKWHRSVEIHLHENGIARKSFSKITVIPWEQVLYVKYRAVKQRINGVPIGTSYNVTITGTDKQKIKLTNNVKDGLR